jgi:hypothetical protein
LLAAAWFAVCMMPVDCRHCHQGALKKKERRRKGVCTHVPLLEYGAPKATRFFSQEIIFMGFFFLLQKNRQKKRDKKF